MSMIRHAKEVGYAQLSFTLRAGKDAGWLISDFWLRHQYIYCIHIYIYTRILKAFQNMSCTTRTTPQNNLLPDIEFNVVDREGHGP